MATKKTTITRDKIVSMYMTYRLENTTRPKSVYLFAKENGFDEAVFYSFFGTLESVEKEIYKIFIEKTIAMIQKDPAYENYDMKSKMLTFYFTFFEILSANRSYVLLSLSENKNQLKNLMLLSGVRTEFKNYVVDIITDEVRTQYDKFQNFQEKAIKESSWLQFLLILKFWIDDDSPAFEKTDLFIEKSVKAVFEVFNIIPLESVLDLGKFLYKEKTQKN
ncbi:TetR family transcriptional regulator C-terminal domain-containing protein [Flavobacterium sp.]|uniref:TetR family transcriptional regulator C-terminal domain-containing protein n=1 Tax=Flavobacterium sp. TaxID=239 RepID=UPI00286DE3A0|nr:TetR family transcriptional regulator C-terminal domain-containing protein [Flavobacterium sp.]